MKTITGKQATDIEAGDRIICRDGGVREVICTFRSQEGVSVAFDNHPSEEYQHHEGIDLA